MAIDTTNPRSRRDILVGALGGVAASIAATLAGAHRVLAAGDDGKTIHVGDSLTDVRSETLLENASNDNALLVVLGNGAALTARSASSHAISGLGDTDHGIVGTTYASGHAGVVGKGLAGHGSRDSTGVYGAVTTDVVANPSPNTAVFGYNSEPNGTAVYGQATNMQSPTYGVVGTVLGQQGVAVIGRAVNEVAGGTGVWGQSNSGSGVGVRGYAWDGYGKNGRFGTGVLGSSGSHNLPPTPRANTGVMGAAGGSGCVGVYGTAPTGRGGQFSGGKAQLRLMPSRATTHPSSGALGDLFLDKGGRLWFCKGGTVWKQFSLV
jgi:hypothetical protein